MPQSLTTHAHRIHSRARLGVRGLVGVAATVAVAAAMARPSGTSKTVMAEPTGVPAAPMAAAHPPAFVVFTQWIDRVLQAPEPDVAVPPVTLQEFTVAPGPATGAYEPAPVILGQPDFPLLGQAAAQAAQQWNPGLNYQGVSLSYVVLDMKGQKKTIRSVSQGLAAGERFKIRYTASFDAVASIDSITGDNPWYGQRAGQVWPKAGMSIQSSAGETVELPMGAGNYFVMRNTPSERHVLKIRHPNARDQQRSNQPAYRQDGTQASQYLQLVPAGSHPAIEQLVMVRGASR